MKGNLSKVLYGSAVFLFAVYFLQPLLLPDFNNEYVRKVIFIISFMLLISSKINKNKNR